MTDMDEDTRIKLIGLKTVGQDLLRQVKAVTNAVQHLVGDDNDESNWCAELIYDDNCTPEKLWERTAQVREGK